jgi:cellulose synthase/poly-beta-1,6-N-acetylglucosamine synthase-like glycosyltransferase
MTRACTFVLPAYNEEHHLGSTLTALRGALDSLACSAEIIVVDNASTDRTAEVARAHGARVVLEPHRQIARARNAGGRSATTPYLVFVDADTAVTVDTVRATLAALDSGRVCGGGARICMDRDPGKLAFALEGWNWIAHWLGLSAGAYIYCLRQAFLETGGFPEHLYAVEDLGFARELKRWGRRRGLRFRMLREPVVTSARKLDWFSGAQLTRTLFTVLFSRGALRDPARLPLWYTRPAPPRRQPEPSDRPHHA